MRAIQILKEGLAKLNVNLREIWQKFKCRQSMSNPPGVTGMCRPNGLLFHQKSLYMGPILVKKILRRESHFTKNQKLRKMVKSAIFEVVKPLEMGPDLQKILKNRQISRFLREKNP